DPDRGGIYIFTGPPVGDNTGHGWTRPASVELFGGPQQHDLSTDCGVRLHGGHGRLAEKNPKHSFRLVFKEKYGPKTLKYPLFGENEPAKFDQLVLRCHFGNAWQHWAEGNRQKAQYTRDVWARRMQRKLGRTSVNALYVHLFLNGMYWGLYNLAERVDEQFGKDHIGGDKSDIDVIKIEEDGGNHIEASAGTLDAWNLMTETVTKATEEAYYQQLDTLLDIDNFIDYMIINQYAGNTDWDHHNWYAIRRHNTENALSEGFRFLCWDSEIILENERENVLSKNNGAQSPTGIFQQLLRNDDFARRYLRRAKQLLKDDGLLGQESVVAVWDSLYHTISTALYDEAARWGDYRRDVHRWQTAGQLYTVDNHYMAERNRLLTQYFPVRTNNVLNQITSYVNIDDFEMPDGWEPLMASMFHEWDGSGINAKPLDKQVKVDWNFNTNAGGGTAIAGFVNVDHNQFADLSAYDKLVLRGTGDGLRILANRLVAHGPWKQINVSFNSYDPYWDSDLQAIVLPLEDLKNAPTNEGRTRNDAFVHLNALKVDWSSMVNVRGAYLIPSAETLDIAHILASRNDNRYYNLQGQPVDHPTKGIYIKN
ncbi:MAG: CotH kinase family protein, partial [Prevotella sp.]|nr:CotH kinase family protein [Prevotella sp.]